MMKKREIKDKMLTVRVSQRELNQLTKFSQARREPRGETIRDLINRAVTNA